MKNKLLRRLRKTHTIQVRNKEYRYFDTVMCYGGVYNQSNWYKDLNFVKEIQRKCILEEARTNYKEPKSV